MVNDRIAVKLATAIAIACLSLIWSLPVNAVEQNFELNSDRGYRLESNFDYEQARDRTIAEQSKGKTQQHIKVLDL